MPSGYSNRTLVLLAILVVVVVAGALAGRMFRSETRAEAGCPRPFASTELAALIVLDGGGLPTGDANDLRPLEDPADTETCRRLWSLLPDTLRVGVLTPHSAAFYEAGEVYVVPVVPNLDPSDVAAMERGEYAEEPHGTTYVFDRAFRLLGEVPNWRT